MKKQLLILCICGLLLIISLHSGCVQNSKTGNNNPGNTPGNIVSTITAKDTDQDGLNDTLEQAIGTDLNNPDTDGDRYSDGVEYNNNLPSYVSSEGRSPTFPAYPNIEIELGDTYHIWLKQDITVATEIIESKDYEYNIESKSTIATNWSNVLNVEAGYSITGISASVKDTFSYSHSIINTLKTSELYRMASATKWSKAVNTNLGDSYIYVTLRIKNIGTDVLDSDIKDIWLSLYVGDDSDPIKTWSFGHDYIGSSIGHLLPGDVRTVNAEFHSLNVDVLKRIDMGEPLRVEIQNYNLGDDERYLQNAKDTLIQLDIDTGSGVETKFVKENQITLTDLLKKYEDAVIDNNKIKSIDNLAINDNSWWNVILPDKTGLSNDISQTTISKGDHVVLIYEQDSDHDGITNRLEFMAGTNPNSVDTDNDGISDYNELHKKYGNTNPILADTDFDGLNDGEEITQGTDGYITDPTHNDTDNDGLSDYEEFLNHTNPTNSDSDQDQLKDGAEIKTYKTNPLVSDTDNDGLTDGDEISYTTDPLKSDTDNDGLKDGAEITAGTNPLDSDTDNDGYLDGQDYVPTKDAKIKVSILKFKVIDEVDGWPDDSNKAQIFFKIYIDDMDHEVGRLPSSGEWNVNRGELVTENNQYLEHNISDNVLIHTVKIIMNDKDIVSDEVLDIDGIHTGSNQNALTLQYNIATGQWTGDDIDGVTDGSDDGSQYTDENDAYLEYNVSTV